MEHWAKMGQKRKFLFCSISCRILENIEKNGSIGPKRVNLQYINTSIIMQKGESQNGCYKKTKNAKCSEKRVLVFRKMFVFLPVKHWGLETGGEQFIQ